MSLNDVLVDIARTPADKDLLSELDCYLKVPGIPTFTIPLTVRVYGEPSDETELGLHIRNMVIENMRVTINGAEVDLGEEAETEIANLVLEE